MAKKNDEKEDVQPKAVSYDAVPEMEKKEYVVTKLDVDKKEATIEEKKGTSKQRLLAKISNIVTNQYGGLETNVPVNHEYWHLKRTYNKNEAAGLKDDAPEWEV